jgi:hypothetical protein
MKNILLIVLFVVIFVLWAFYYLFQKPESRKSLSELLIEKDFAKDVLVIVRYVDDEYLFEEYTLEENMTVSVDVLLKEEIIISLFEAEEDWTIINHTNPLSMHFSKSEILENYTIRRHFNFLPKQSGNSTILLKGSSYNNININFEIL